MKRYNMPHRSRVVKTRLTDEEYADFTARLAPYGMSQSEFIRQAITRATIRPIVTVSPVNDELLAAVWKLTAEYGRIGGNLNQIARYLNEYGVPYNALSGEVRAAISVPWVKADDIVVGFHIFPFLVLAIAEIGAQTGNSKIFFAAVQRGKAVALTGRNGQRSDR